MKTLFGGSKRVGKALWSDVVHFVGHLQWEGGIPSVQPEKDHQQTYILRNEWSQSFIRRNEVQSGHHHLNGEGLIRLLNFLAHFKHGANIKKMVEAQVFLRSPTFLGRFTLCKHNVILGTWTSTEKESPACSSLRAVRRFRKHVITTVKEILMKVRQLKIENMCYNIRINHPRQFPKKWSKPFCNVDYRSRSAPLKTISGPYE